MDASSFDCLAPDELRTRLPALLLGAENPVHFGTDDNNLYYDWLASLLPVDVFMPNAGYRGNPARGVWDFFDLWSGNDAQNFSGWHRLSCEYQVPVLIGEINPVGYENPPDDLALLPHAFPHLWRDLLQHVSEGAVGGFFFEWTDEPWKAFGRQDKLGINSVAVNCSTSEGCSDQPDVFIADTIAPKNWQFDAVCCGRTADGEPYNLATDPFALLGRPPYTLETVTQECPSEYLLAEIPERSGYRSQYASAGNEQLPSTRPPVPSLSPPSRESAPLPRATSSSESCLPPHVVFLGVLSVILSVHM